MFFHISKEYTPKSKESPLLLTNRGDILLLTDKQKEKDRVIKLKDF